METKAFLEKIGPAAVQAMKESGVLASLIIAQAALESAWGASAPGNMLFGVKAGTTWKGKTQLLTTHEVIKGHRVKVKALFRAYDSWLDSLRDHTRLLTTATRYRAVVGERDYKKACKAIQAAGYATDPKYADKLIGLIEKYQLQKWDSSGGEVLKDLDKATAEEIIKNVLQPAWGTYHNAGKVKQKNAVHELAEELRDRFGIKAV